MLASLFYYVKKRANKKELKREASIGGLSLKSKGKKREEP
jgi:hypothetical protein